MENYDSIEPKQKITLMSSLEMLEKKVYELRDISSYTMNIVDKFNDPRPDPRPDPRAIENEGDVDLQGVGRQVKQLNIAELFDLLVTKIDKEISVISLNLNKISSMIS